MSVAEFAHVNAFATFRVTLELLAIVQQRIVAIVETVLFVQTIPTLFDVVASFADVNAGRFVSAVHVLAAVDIARTIELVRIIVTVEQAVALFDFRNAKTVRASKLVLVATISAGHTTMQVRAGIVLAFFAFQVAMTATRFARTFERHTRWWTVDISETQFTMTVAFGADA